MKTSKKIYRISQTVNNDYDTFDSFVVCANDEEDAKLVVDLDGQEESYGDWVKNTKDIDVEYLGEAKKELERGVVLGSFNAG